MATHQQPKRPTPDPHFEQLHGPPLSYARSLQTFLRIHDPQPAPTNMELPAEASIFSHPTVPDAVDFTKGKTVARDMPPPPTPGFLSGFQTPCESICSVINCESGCNPSVLGSGTCSLSQCNNVDQCTSEDCCREPACLDHSSLPTTRPESIDFASEDQYISPVQQQFVNSGAVFPAYDDLPGFQNLDKNAVQCHWLLPDQQCDIIAPTNDALSQHIFHDHIQPGTSLTCGWFDCDEQINAQHLTDHVWNNHHPEQHVPDSYICLWDGCMEMFSDAEQLETHMEVAHTQMESIDCRWGGCGTIATNSAELQSHVNKEHLHLFVQPAFPPSNLEVDLSDSHTSRRSNHPLYWTPENDNLLMRVRAQNLTFKQIASQYFPDKSAKACQFRYARVYHQQEQSDQQFAEQSTTPLSCTPSQPASYTISPSQSHYPSADPTLTLSHSDSPSNLAGQPVLDRIPVQGNHKCLWITNASTETMCEAQFGHPNELQAHIESSHQPLSEDRKRKPPSSWVCNWNGCKRNGETRGSRDKLKKHVWTHTGCKSAFLKQEPFVIAHSLQSIRYLANTAEKDSETTPNLQSMSALIRVRSHTSAMYATWLLLAEMACVSARMDMFQPFALLIDARSDP